MRIDILTLFPDMFSSLKESIIAKATEKNIIEINLIDIRDFSKDKHKKCDDYPFGGGAGMVMTPQPIYDAIQSVKTENSKVVYMSPKGRVLSQEIVKEYSKFEHLIILCGHYEGIDQRIIDLCVDEIISIGDYVLTGGEIPAMVLVDSVSRYIPGVLGTLDSLDEESHANGLLEYPQYTRPQNFMGLEVPDVLISGHHENVRKWREQKSIETTRKYRPDLLGE